MDINNSVIDNNNNSEVSQDAQDNEQNIAEQSSPISQTPSPETPQVTEDTIKTDSQPTAQEVYDWLKDKRAETMWKRNPNELYKSYVNLEKAYTPIKQKYGELEKTFKELNVQPDKLKNIITEYNELTNPNNPIIKKLLEYHEWSENPLYKEQFNTFIADLRNRELQRKFPNMTQEQIERQMATENELKEVKTYLQRIEEEKLVTKYKDDISKGLEDARKYASARGFEWSDDVNMKVLQYADENRISPDNLFYAFLKLYDKDLDNSYTTKKEREILEKLQKNKSSNVVSAGTKSAPSIPKKSFKDGILSALGGKE